ncbi:hypothetical protein B4113_2207 [Geobacillus sp. B4113_201601]|nr:hypothetical protein B4113_2207 [Geobacillus sp. B4113_201601]
MIFTQTFIAKPTKLKKYYYFKIKVSEGFFPFLFFVQGNAFFNPRGSMYHQ